MREVPEQTYYPAARCRLIVRFDEFGETDTPKVPEKPPQNRSGKKSAINALKVVRKGTKLVLESQGGTSQPGGPQKQVVSADERTHAIDGVIPRRATLQRNNIRQPDTLSVEFRFSDLPLDPRSIRSAAIEFYLGTLSQEDFEGGLRGESRQPPGQSGGADNASAPLNVLADVDPASGLSNLRFQGWVDDWEAEFAESDEPIIKLECTDNTRLFIEQSAPPKRTIEITKPIDEAFANYLADFPQFDGMEVEYRPGGVDIPMLKTIMSPVANAATQQDGGGKGPPPPGGGADKPPSVWDYLTDVAGYLGHTLRVDGITVVIQRARTLYGSAFTGRADDPFVGRVLPSGLEFNRRLMIYGRNIAEMSFKRKYNRHAPMNIEIHCYSGLRKKTLISRYPQKPDRQKHLTPGDAADEKWNIRTVYGIDDEKILAVIAQGVYESIGRNEVEVNLVTKDLGSYGGSNADPDLLFLEPGDAIDVRTNRESEQLNTAANIEDQKAMRAESFLRSLGYTPDFAKAYGRSVSNVNFQNTYRTRSVVFDWDADGDGVVVHIEAVNYVEVRADKQLPESQEINPDATTSPSPVKVTVPEGL